MTKAIQLSKQADSNYYPDLAFILDEHGKTKDAVKILEKIRKLSTQFKEEHEAEVNELATGKGIRLEMGILYTIWYKIKGNNKILSVHKSLWQSIMKINLSPF